MVVRKKPSSSANNHEAYSSLVTKGRKELRIASFKGHNVLRLGIETLRKSLQFFKLLKAFFPLFVFGLMFVFFLHVRPFSLLFQSQQEYSVRLILLWAVLITSPIIVSIGLPIVYSRLRVSRIWSRAAILHRISVILARVARVIPPLLFLYGLALSSNFIVELIRSKESAKWDLIGIITSLAIAFILPWLLPAAWNSLERVWWPFSLGRTTTAYMLKDWALKDFERSLKKKETDETLPPVASCLLAVNTRLIEFPYLHRILESRKYESEKRMFKPTIMDLNKAWKAGLPPQILNAYIDYIEKTSVSIKNDTLRRCGRSAVANVRYLIGDSKRARRLANNIWDEAEHEASKGNLVPRWIAAYAYFTTTGLVSCNFREAMDAMATLWNAHHHILSDENRVEVEQEIDRLHQSELVTLHPIAAIPRLIILFAALESSAEDGSWPWEKEEWWPSQDAFASYELNEPDQELRWVQCWYVKAIEICKKHKATRIGLYFSHACAGFYFTLLSIEGSTPAVRNRAMTEGAQAFEKIELEQKRELEQGKKSYIAARYLHAGFYGIYELVTKNNPERALELLREAAGYSEITGNRFAFIAQLFSCCHAVAAIRINAAEDRNLEPEVKYYLRAAQDLAEKMGHHFYMGIYEAARAEVSKRRGKNVEAERQKDSSVLMMEGRQRVLSIFEKTFQS
jgi:hypothetical protein